LKAKQLKRVWKSGP